jgi:hypothetical protein
MTVHNINFSAPAKLITSISPSYISKNGPYIAAYVGRINKENPKGECYYIRPFSLYDEKTGRLTIVMTTEQSSVHANENRVCKDILFDGEIVIQDFDYSRSSANRVVHVNMNIINNTGHTLRNVSIHNGLIHDNEFTFIGRIAYFLFSTNYWIAKKREFRKRSVPVEKVLPATNFIVEVSK